MRIYGVNFAGVATSAGLVILHSRDAPSCTARTEDIRESL